MMAIVAQAEQSLNLERKMTKREQPLTLVTRKLLIASTKVLSAQNSAPEKAEEVRKFREEVKDDKNQLEIGHDTARKVREDTKMPMAEASKTEAD